MSETANPRTIAVLGSGGVGRTLSAGLAAAGHDVVLGSRAPGDADLQEWCRRTGVPAAAPEDAAGSAEIIVNATPGDASVDAVRAAGGAHLVDTVLLDVSNPLDFSTGSPRVFTDQDASVGERLQHEFPGLRVVKSLCTVNNAIMVDPALLGQPTTMFLAGDDPDAKRRVTDLLADLGWGRDDVVDLGDITGARVMEHNILLWLRIYGALGTVDFNIRLVRES